MTKWLVITLLALTGFMVIMLGLGYLLSENEKATTLLKNQLEQQAQLAQQKTDQSNALDNYTNIITTGIDSKASAKQADAKIMKSFEQTLLNNLTCMTVAQCQVESVKFKNTDCHLASNIIGVSQLKKIATEAININTCPIVPSDSQLACQQNICTFISSSK